MKKMFLGFMIFVAVFVFAVPIMALIVERDAMKTAERPNVVVVHREIPDSKAPEKCEPPNDIAYQCISAMNAGYEDMWESEEIETPKAAKPPRYVITDNERWEIERIVASEGGYCEYGFQALVAECILNGCEAENMRPLELFKRGDFWVTHDIAPTEVTKQAVSDVFDKGIMPTTQPVRYYYNPNYCISAAHESMCYVLTCCECRFFKDWE